MPDPSTDLDDDLDIDDGTLRHVARPANPKERHAADAISLQDYEAVYFQTALRDYAAYDAPNADYQTVALAYAEHIDREVREEMCSTAKFYCHTELSKKVLLAAAAQRPDGDSGFGKRVHEKVSTQVSELLDGSGEP